MKLPPSNVSPELEQLLERAREQYAAMTPAQRQAMLRAQRRSWAIGELMLEHDNLTYAEACRRVDNALAENT